MRKCFFPWEIPGWSYFLHVFRMVFTLCPCGGKRGVSRNARVVRKPVFAKRNTVFHGPEFSRNTVFHGPDFSRNTVFLGPDIVPEHGPKPRLPDFSQTNYFSEKILFLVRQLQKNMLCLLVRLNFGHREHPTFFHWEILAYCYRYEYYNTW